MNPMDGWFDLGGTIRAATAEQTLKRLRPKLARFGITRIARITGLDHIGIPVSVAVRPASKLLATSQGKGTTPELADISAAMESIETWHAENLPPPARIASLRELARDSEVLDPATLKRPPRLRHPFDPDVQRAWHRGTELGSGRSILLPSSYLDLDTAGRAAPQALTFRVTTTGLASGNTLGEALLHGLCEVVERDAHYRLLQLEPGERRARLVDLNSVEDPINRDLLDRLHDAGMHVEVEDMAFGIALPAFRVTIRELDSAFRFFWDEGAGAHPKPEIALSRALTEAVQSRLAYISGARDDFFPDAYRLQIPQAAQRSDTIERATGRRPMSACPRPRLERSISANLELVRRLVNQPVVYFDHTRPEHDVSVVHVICPPLNDVVGLESA